MRLARGQPAELVGAVDLRRLLQLVDALGQKAVDGLLAAEDHAALLHAEARFGQQVERRALARRVAQHQHALVLLASDRRRRERIDLLVAVAKRQPGEHNALLAVKVRLDCERTAHDALGQRALEGHRARALERRQQLGDHTRALLRVKAEGRLAVPSRLQHHAHDVLLLRRQAQHVALAEDEAAVLPQRPQGFGHLRAHLQLASASGHAEEQLRLSVEHAGDVINLLAEGELERLGHQQLHQPGDKAVPDAQPLGLQARLHQPALQLADVGRVLQQADDLFVHARKAHPLRLEHKALAEGHRLPVRERVQELRHRLDDVHALLPHAQGHAHRLLPNELQRDLHFQRRLHRQRRLNRAHQLARVLPGTPAANLLDRAGGHRLQHRRRQMAAGLVHVAEEIARAAAAEPAARAHAHHAPRVVVHDKAQHARLLLHRMHAARPVQRQARRIFLLRRDAPERLHHVFRHRYSSSRTILNNLIIILRREKDSCLIFMLSPPKTRPSGKMSGAPPRGIPEVTSRD